MSIECEGGWSGEECLLVGATVMRNGPGWCLETSTGFLSSPGGLLSMAPPGASPVRQQGLCYFFFFLYNSKPCRSMQRKQMGFL